jgi:dTDP-4-dehydrorhamnose reductase
MLVTGGSGYVGGWVARLARDNWDVAATFFAHAVAEPGISWYRLDVREKAAVASLVEQLRPDVIVHTAALNPGQGDDLDGINVTGTGNVARVAAIAGVRLIHTSTDVVFDGTRGNYTESDIPNPVTGYGATKAAAEAEVTASGAAAVIIRSSLVYGWRPTVARAAQWMIDAVNRGEPLRLWVDELRCPIWVESLAGALVELAGLGYTGFLHLGGSQVVSRHEFGLALLRFAGADTTLVEAVPTPEDWVRPLDCTMDTSLARSLLSTPLPGLDEVLRRGDEILE